MSSKNPGEGSIQARIIGGRRIYRLMTLAVVALSIVAAVKSVDPEGKTLREAATILTFLLTVVLAAASVVNLADGPQQREEVYELNSSHDEAGKRPVHGARWNPALFVVIAALLLVREAYMIASIDDPKVLINEKFWYPLSVLPELLAALLLGYMRFVEPGSRQGKV